MIKVLRAYGGFSVPDLQKAKQFYGDTLGLKVIELPEGLDVEVSDGTSVFIYPSQENKPAMYTVLNFVVENVDAAVDELANKGVHMEQYDMPEMKTDAKGVVRNDGTYPGPKAIAWFKDPAGNILSIIQEK